MRKFRRALLIGALFGGGLGSSALVVEPASAAPFTCTVTVTGRHGGVKARDSASTEANSPGTVYPVTTMQADCQVYYSTAPGGTYTACGATLNLWVYVNTPWGWKFMAWQCVSGPN